MIAQNWEKDWWGTCVNTYGEERKQLLYANRMGLNTFHNGKSPYNFNMKGKSVLDIGGGPTSLLLKCTDVMGKVIDPLKFPQWVIDRYSLAGIDFVNKPGEELNETGYDEIWIYNVLQHVENPGEILSNARKAGKLVRIFEWIDTPTNIGHPHSLSEQWLNKQLDGIGKVELLDGLCKGKGYYGIFPI